MQSPTRDEECASLAHASGSAMLAIEISTLHDRIAQYAEADDLDFD
jgi:hypothetical protein